MNDFIQLILEKEEQLDSYLAAVPMPSLKQGYKIERRYVKGNPYYYLRYYNNGNRDTVYLGTPKSEKAYTLLRETVYSEIKERICANKDLLNQLIKSYRPLCKNEIMLAIDSDLSDIPIESLECDYLLTMMLHSENDESKMYSKEYLELLKWANANYEKNSAPFGDSLNITCDGTRVRSKGESLWYNALYKANLPFRNDVVIHLKDKNGFTITKSPDFLIKCLDGTFIIIEHLGLLSNSKYLKEFIEKVELYHRNGFVLGVNFFVTADDHDYGTDSQAIENMVKMIKERVLR